MNEKEDSVLKKEFGVLEVFSIASGAMISSGLFILPAVIYKITGPAVILAYCLAAVLVVPAMFSKAELATAMPKSGGDCFFIYRSFGPVLGSFAGFATWFSLALKSSFALLGIGIFLVPLVPFFTPEMIKTIAVGFTLLFTLMNIISVKGSGKFQVVLVLSLVFMLLFYVFSGVNYIEVYRFVPFRPKGWVSVFTATGMVFVSFGGLTKVASVAEEIKNPKQTIVKGMFSAFFVVSLLYIFVVFITVGLLDKQQFLETLTPISAGATVFFGSMGFIILSVAGIIASITTGNAGLLAASRSPLSMAKDNLMPSFFGQVNQRFNTPIISILITSFFMILVIIFLDLEGLVKVASTMKLILFSLVNISVIFMRESKVITYQPSYKSPLYPYIQIVGTVAYIALIIEMGTTPLLITLGFFILSMMWYFFYCRSSKHKNSALIHIVERVTSQKIKSSSLGEELKEILRERDEIGEDRFDRLIKKAEVIDVEEPMSRHELFEILGETFSKKFDGSASAIVQLMEEREQDSTTAIYDGLAIPHIVVEGENLFDIVLVRAKHGIYYGDDVPPVKIVFALAGSMDERNFHLQALMAIAQIVQDKKFLKNWLNARNHVELKHSVFLPERVRREEE